MATLNEALAATAEVNNNGTTVKVEEAMIIPGTTPDLVVKIPSTVLNSTTKCRMDVKQNGKLILQQPATIGDSNVSYHFSQEESYEFKEGEIRVQFHGLRSDNNAWKTYVFTVEIGETLSTTTIE